MGVPGCPEDCERVAVRVPEGKEAVSQIIMRRVALTVEVWVEKKPDGLYYATARWADRSKSGTVLIRAQDEKEAVDECLRAAGYEPDDTEQLRAEHKRMTALLGVP